jgi:hypothetical protein
MFGKDFWCPEKISVCVPSYKRPKDVITKKLYPFIKLFVDESEYDEYKKYNPEQEIVKLPSGVQGNIARVRNYILDYEFKNKTDAVVMMDDDNKGLFKWRNAKPQLVDKDEFFIFIKKYSILAYDWGAVMWGVNINKDKQIYKEFNPFSTVSYVGAPFMCFIKDDGTRFDERIPLKEDYDICVQLLNKHRIVLRVNSYYYNTKQSENKGGCAVMRNIDEEKRQFEILQKKWGSKIIHQGASNQNHRGKKVRKIFDYNPILIVPIKGI